jgi:Uma2 family endonuclease
MNLLLQGPITAEEFLHLPEAKGCELVDGRLVEIQMGAKSSYVGGMVYYYIQNYLLTNPLGWAFPQDASYQFLPSRPNLVRKPDVSFIRRGRLPEEKIPEVVSPNDLYYEVEQKVAEYRAAGIPLIWIVNPPTRTILIRRGNGTCSELGENGELSGEDILPGFRCLVSALFQGLRNAPEMASPSA